MIALIKYNAGNISSVKNALNRLGCASMITDDMEAIQKADKVIFPGVGEASSAMKYLKEKKMDELIKELKQPTLGICLGLQLMCTHSEEANTECLGIFEVEVKQFPIKNTNDKVPHMGWNNFENINGALFKHINTNDDVYYVHSFYAEINTKTQATCNYIVPFSAAMEKDNFYATQFHPEKSASVGAQILKNFLDL